jgi:hypothetical protein
VIHGQTDKMENDNGIVGFMNDARPDLYDCFTEDLHPLDNAVVQTCSSAFGYRGILSACVEASFGNK